MEEKRSYGAELCAMGKALLQSDKPLDRTKGMRYIMRAYALRDMEAQDIVADMMLHGTIVREQMADPKTFAIQMLLHNARQGDLHARNILNAYCIERYDAAVTSTVESRPAGPLVDVEGKRIKIKRTGLLTPVDAVLSYRDGVNRLDLSFNVQIFPVDTGNCEGIADPDRYKQAVLDGIRLWEGRYLVFGNQPLEVAMHITNKVRLWDTVTVLSMTSAYAATMQRVADKLGTEATQNRVRSLVQDERSFVPKRGRWSVRSRKSIFLFSETGAFDDYEEIKHVAKHEFGHVLGLGDLYRSPVDGLEGVAKGTYPELDGFSLMGDFYNLVMCDHHGVVSNNDIEMVLLAFRTNKEQLYQKQFRNAKISKALGQGN